MNKKKPTCKMGLKKNILKKDVFERELAMCRKLAEENGKKCCWGVCEKCGVVPLLYKLHKGILLDEPGEISRVRNKVVSKD